MALAEEKARRQAAIKYRLSKQTIRLDLIVEFLANRGIAGTHSCFPVVSGGMTGNAAVHVCFPKASVLCGGDWRRKGIGPKPRFHVPDASADGSDHLRRENVLVRDAAFGIGSGTILPLSRVFL